MHMARPRPEHRDRGSSPAITPAGVLSYLGVLLVPHLALHQASDLGEPELADAWRGIYGHKNIAAGVMAVFVYAQFAAKA
jgi:O-antigen ligase